MKSPPHDLALERALLGALLFDGSDLLNLGLQPSDFYTRVHQAIFEACLHLGPELDLVTLQARLRETNQLEEVTSTYLAQLFEESFSSAKVRDYAKIVKEGSTRRSLLHDLSALSQLAQGGDFQTLLEKIQVLSEVKAPQSLTFDSASDIAGTVVDRLRGLAEGKRESGLHPGLDAVLRPTGGLYPGQLVVVGARPGVGKTSFGMEIAEAVAGRFPVGVISLEMSTEELLNRMVCKHSGINYLALRRGNLGEDIASRLERGYQFLLSRALYFDSRSGLSVGQIRGSAQAMVEEYGIKLLLVDYLQLVTPGQKMENRTVELGYVARTLKELAMKLEIPVLALSQLNRESEKRKGNRPQMSDLRASGEIEEAADVVMFLHRESLYLTNDLERKEKENEEGNTELIIAKNRAGALGIERLHFEAELTKFRNVRLD